jgi:hypothetical protein
MNQDEKLAREKEVQIGRLCEEWFEKVGRAFLESEKKQILKERRTAIPSDLVKVQAKYNAVVDLMSRLANVTNKKNSSAKKLYNNIGGDNSGF